MDNQPSDRKNVKGEAGITAGGNVDIDNTGLLAIGKYINQFKIENTSGEALAMLIDFLDQKRRESVNKEILSCYTPSALPDYPPRLKEFVTGNRVDELTQALIYLQDHRILLISGVGGVGKTTLARALMETRPANVPLPFWFDFSKNIAVTLANVLEKLASYMNRPEMAKFEEEGREAGQDDINRLTDELQEPLWLVFDNLETTLNGMHFQDPGIDSLFTSLEEKKQELKGLKLNFAVDYMTKNGLENVAREKLEELANGVDGHPLALRLLVGVAKAFGASDTLEDLSMYQKDKEDTIKKTRRLFDKLAGDEKELLERISVYRRPESMAAVKMLFTNKTSVDAVEKLIDNSLLETNHKGSYWLHPLVREFAHDDLGNKIESHKIVSQYYLSLHVPEKRTKKEDVLSLIEAHHHACMAQEYDKAVDIISDYNLHEDLDRWGNYRTLVELYHRLLPEDPFNDKPVLGSIGTHGVVLGNLGLAYSDLGQVEKAIEYYEQALVISRGIGDRCGEGNHLGNLGLAYSDLGQVEKAIEYYEQALVISRGIGDRRGEGNHLGNLGLAYSNLGQVEKAIEYYEQALVISRGIGDRRGEGTGLGNLGSAYYHLGQVEKAIEYYEQALVISREIGDRRGEGNRLGNLGSAYSDLGQVEKAIEYYEQALAIGKEIKDPRIIDFCVGKLELMENSDITATESRWKKLSNIF
jgi:tetratricopeptide (TPR) repeat protein